MQSITVGGNTYSLVAMPATPGFVDIELGINDAIAVLTSPFTRQEQTQGWPGGDFWDGSITPPPMTRAQAWPWEGFLAELRGRLNVFQCGDPRAATPLGRALGVPVAANTGSNNLPMTWSLATTGWLPSRFDLLLPGDQFQIGYRLHRVCERVNSDASGNATIIVSPSLRETPAAAAPLILNAPRGLFRLASNRRAIQASKTRLTTFSMKLQEVK